MAMHFSKDDVRRHLDSLGYKNVTDRQLKEFMTDLKKLIRYEERQKRIESHLEFRKLYREEVRCRSADSTYSSAGESLQSTPRGERRPRKSQIDFKCDVTRESSTTTVSYENSSSSSNLSLTKERVKETASVRVEIRVPSPPSASDFDGGCFELLHKPGETKQILPPRPPLPSKPTKSFIKPLLNDPKRKPAARDPVQLYDQYKKHWDKLKLPGDNSTKQLRWAVREWMMGEPK